ncbi:PilC/PilY family type IV pilus protein [Imhoffiella purpurea]|uniref:Type IV fimbrial biogenesis protein PilY1 n=1 Tax=Imhoffiella purpurea TaxID=1249627 RepID=W9V8G8_9GAMM|nr:PilC/PilY family type IV pilus protein [Imhoffiella purpurea]EXJ15873.1 Type IV fimbrial biogenesis protein PilY1 [Imhoffiella purpurea]
MSDRDDSPSLMNKSKALLLGFVLACPIASVVAEDLAQYPLFGGGGIGAPPLTMIVMGRDHTLYYEAYNDASDLSGDGVLDVGYKPNMVDADGNQVDYFGYFDSYLCYSYTNGRFEPVGTTSTKKCSGSWSGDFLNYITTARIDALRKVLYGGRRIVDTDTETVIERSYIPQDAHSWGKEYKGVEHDGYDISDYTPLSQPLEGTRHLFANTTLLKSGNKEPLMRVLNDSRFRIWEWVAIERPVAGDDCIDHSTKCETNATTLRGSHPNNAVDFQALIDTWGTQTQQCNSDEIGGGRIDGTGNPFSNVAHCSNDYYLTVISGQIYVPKDGDYQFATNGDDAVELLIDNAVITGWYGNHAARNDNNIKNRANNTGSVVTKALSAGWHDFEFHHEEGTGGDSFQLLWKPPSESWAIVPASSLRDPSGGNNAPTITTYSMERTVSASRIADYNVRVQVCDSEFPDSNCKSYYPAGTLKPVGLLQDYGESDEMLFGLLSGSFKHPTNMRGGVLRKNIESFQDEVDPDTGIFTNVVGIVKTIDRFRIVDFNMNSNYQYQGGWLTTAPMSDSNSQFPDWGNPIGEMMYETLRYFSGKGEATTEFLPSLTNGKERVTLRDYSGDSYIDLPAPDWKDPYTREENPALYCAPGAQLVISDVNPSYDSTYVPGTSFGSFSGDITGLNVTTEANAIWDEEHGGSSLHFIGQVGADYDGAPSAKTVSGLGNIRGLSPSAPTKQGSYYSAAIARYAYKNDLRDNIDDKQDINTFAVALASPLPRIDIPVGDSRVTLVPFAKSVGGNSINASKGRFQPTNQIVDFFVDTFANTDPDGSDADPDVNDGCASVKFRINYEDVEQGADHDMDAIVVYEVKVKPIDNACSNTLTVTLTSEYAAGGIIQHMGYVISGTDNDGVYLEVRDKLDGQGAGNDPDYFLDTPTGVSPGGCAGSSPPTACAINGVDTPLLFVATRTFVASSTGDAATVLDNPLWYAAKYGSEGNEGLAKGEPSPNYFLVTNAGKLKDQLSEAFNRIIKLDKTSAVTVAASSTQTQTDTTLYRAAFDPDGWIGELKAVKKDDTILWDAATLIPSPDDRHIYTWDNGDRGEDASVTPTGIAFDWDYLNPAQKALLQGAEPEAVGENLVNWLRGASVTGYRSRETLLGDIVNSDPLYIREPGNDGYAAMPEGTPGRDTYIGDGNFILNHADRKAMIYVGANDGMLHAFEAATGVEKFAYIPNAVFENLPRLADPDYPDSPNAHRYFVDGSPSIGDAYINSAWRSVLIGSLGAGGRAVFALDVTDPDAFDATKVLWEFTDDDLGLLVGQMSQIPDLPPPPAVIGRLHNGAWAAIFGNGYDSGTGAWLYIVNLADGSLIKKIQVSGDVQNGLSAVSLMRDNSYTVVGAYAGDLKGNLWKFDLTGSSVDDWKVAYDGSSVFQASYETKNLDGDTVTVYQPITGAVEVSEHPAGGYMVYFGTGQYMRPSDPGSRKIQSVYGIWDNAILKYAENPAATTWEGGEVVPIPADGNSQRDSLVEQEILYEVDNDGNADTPSWPVISNYPIKPGSRATPSERGWFIDLTSPTNGPQGERIVSRLQFLKGTTDVIFTTLIPIESDDPCQAGDGRSRICRVNMLSGGGPKTSKWDVSGDGKFNSDDLLTVGDEKVAATCVETAMTDAPRILLPSDDVDDIPDPTDDPPPDDPPPPPPPTEDPAYDLKTSTGDDPKTDAEAVGRQSWRQLR